MTYRIVILLLVLLAVSASARDTTYYIPDDFATVEIFMETPNIDSIINSAADTILVIVDSYFVEHAGVINANDHFLMDTAGRIIVTVADAYRHHGEYDTLTNYTLEINTAASPWVWDDGGPHIIEYMQINFSGTGNDGMNSSTVFGDGEWAWMRNNLCTFAVDWLFFNANTPKRMFWTNNVFFGGSSRTFEYNDPGTDAYFYNNLFISTPSWFQNDAGGSTENFELINNVIINCTFCDVWEAFGADIDPGANYLFAYNIWDDTTTGLDTVNNIAGSVGMKWNRTLIMEGGLSDSNFHWAVGDTAARDYGVTVTGDPDGGYLFDFEGDPREPGYLSITGTTDIEDTYLHNGAGDLNFGGSGDLEVTAKNTLVRPLNLATLLPAEATITSMACSLYNNNNVTSTTISAFRVYKPWGEGTGDFTDPAGDGSATWNDWANDDSEWGTAGCEMAKDDTLDNSGDGVRADRRATAEDSFTAVGFGWYSFSISDSLAQGWYDGTMNEEGILLKVTSGAAAGATFNSTENGANQIRWYVTYTLGDPWDCGPDEFVAAAGGAFIGGQIVYIDPPYYNHRRFVSWQDMCSYLYCY